MRSKLVLFKILRENTELYFEKILRKHNIYSGVCTVLYHIYSDKIISREEYILLRNYIKVDKVNAKLKEHKTFVGEVYWWELTDEGAEQRLLFLDSLILSAEPFWKRVLKKIFN